MSRMPTGYTRASTITPNDGANLTDVPDALLVTAGGVVVMDLCNGGPTQINVVDLISGTIIELCPSRVYATGTTGTVIGLHRR